MPSAKSYGLLHEQVATRPGATKRLAKLRKETLAEIELQELRGVLKLSQTDLAEAMGIQTSSISQAELGARVRRESPVSREKRS